MDAIRTGVKEDRCTIWPDRVRTQATMGTVSGRTPMRMTHKGGPSGHRTSYLIAFRDPGSRAPAAYLAPMHPLATIGTGCLILVQWQAFGQDLVRAAGAALPSREALLAIPSEHYSPPAGGTLPERVDLSPWFPPAGDQFAQASCSGWALGYALGTYHWNRQRGRYADTILDPASVISPGFLYNVVALNERLKDCRSGVRLTDAIAVACDTGMATWADFPMDTATTNCLRPVTMDVLAAARLHRLADPRSISVNDPAQWRHHLGQGEPIVCMFSVGNSFYDDGVRPERARPYSWTEMQPPPGDLWRRDQHIMVCTGYDSDGSFNVLNSWGLSWGDNGYIRVPDTLLSWACTAAYVIGHGTAPAAPAPARPKMRTAGSDGRIRGGLGRREVHRTNGLDMRTLGTAAEGERHWIEVRQVQGDMHLYSFSVRPGHPVTFHHSGSLYTITCTGRGLLSRQLRYELVKDHPQQLRILEDRFQIFDLHGDGLIDGKW
jgi:hypothetical protein